MRTLTDPDPAFPEAAYFIVASRLRPGLDGGYTVATMQRAQQMRELGGADVELLTFDPAPVDGDLERFIELGLADAGTRMRNLFAELRAHPSLVRSADAVARLHPTDTGDVGERGTDVVAADGTLLLRLPFVARPDWHRTDAEIPVFAADGSLLGALHGFGELYRLWVDSLVGGSRADDPERPVVVISEAKQLGELLSAGERDYALLHTVHNAHTEPPYAWDAPMNTLWEGWFDTIDRYDGVIWLTAAQRADAIRRFGAHPGWVVVPHPAAPPASASDADPVADSVAPTRDPLRAVMIARLAEQKRVEDAIRAWSRVRALVPGARLDIYGDGPLRASLDELVASLDDAAGLDGSVVLHGYVGRAADELATAGLLVMTSRYEGQSLAITEALAAGTPVVAYDVPYGPAELVTPTSGVLVPSGDVDALADAVATILGDPARIAELSAGASAWAHAHTAPHAMAATAGLVRDALARRADS